MTDPITTQSDLWKVIVQAAHESVDSLATFTDDGKVEIAVSKLKVILVLLEFHPNELVRRSYIQSIQELMAGKRISWTPKQLSSMKVLRVSKNPRPADDVLGEVLDIIIEYGASVEKSKKKKQKRDVNNKGKDK